jgi:hypothetical protein
MESTLTPNEILEKDPLQMYVDEQLRYKAATDLIIWSVEMYHASYIKNNLDKYITFQTLSMPEKIKYEHFQPMVFNHSTNCFTICTVFENYAKARLLYTDVLVHTYKNKTIRQQQRMQPVSCKGATIELIKTELNPELTIGMKELLSDPYNKALDVSPSLLNFLKHIRVPRNKLHFMYQMQYSTNEEFIAGLKEANEFITVNMVNTIREATGHGHIGGQLNLIPVGADGNPL